MKQYRKANDIDDILDEIEAEASAPDPEALKKEHDEKWAARQRGRAVGESRFIKRPTGPTVTGRYADYK